MVRVISEMHIESFQFWGGAKHWVRLLRRSELLRFEEWINEATEYEPIDETALNDELWFMDDDLWLEIFGISKDQILEERTGLVEFNEASSWVEMWRETDDEAKRDFYWDE